MRLLLVTLLLFSGPTALHADSAAEREKKAMNAITQLGGNVLWDASSPRDSEETKYNVSIHTPQNTDAILEHLKDLDHCFSLDLSGTRVSDKGLASSKA